MSPKTGRNVVRDGVDLVSGGNRETFRGTNSYTLVADFTLGIKAEMLSKKSLRFEHYVAKRNDVIHDRNMDARKRSCI